MKIVVIGAGHIGLITSLSLAHFGHTVLCVDVDQQKINLLSDAKTEIFEPGLEQLLKQNLTQNRIQFSTDYKKAITFSDIFLIAVGTPTTDQNKCDLTALEKALTTIQNESNNTIERKIIIIKSTVPPGTCKKLQNSFNHFDFVSCPEFLREGQAIYDALHPDRIIAGSFSQKALAKVKELYQPFLLKEDCFITMDPTSSELSKYAANTFLAARISLINEFASLCEKIGADIESVALGLSKDPRIGPSFLKAGVGYGGSCFPKDLNALIQFGNVHKQEMMITQAVKSVNSNQLTQFINKIVQSLKSSDGAVALWGLSFKPETNDIREAPSLKIIKELLAHDFKINIYDPVTNENVKQAFKDHPQFTSLSFFSDKISVLDKAQALIVVTEWDEFAKTEIQQIKDKLSTFKIFDGRNIFSKVAPHYPDLVYTGVGVSLDL